MRNHYSFPNSSLPFGWGGTRNRSAVRQSVNSPKRLFLLVRSLVFAMTIALPGMVYATHDQAPISDIDHSGMGTFTGTYTQSATDHPWFVFNAVAGNTITIDVNTNWSQGSHSWLYQAPDGCAEIGDNSEDGTLQLLTNTGSGSNSYSITYAVTTTGQYALQLDSWLGGDGAYTVTISGSTVPTVLCTTGCVAPNLFTAYGENQPVPPGNTSASVCQNAGNVTFQFDNCIGGTVNWTGTDGSMGNGNIIATSANVGTVTYSATCTIEDCTSEASEVSVTTTAPPVVTPGPNKSVVLGYPGPGSNCTNISADATGSGTLTYNWMPGNKSGPTVNVCPEVTTIYEVTVTDANGCTSTGQVTVFVKDVRCGPNNQYVSVCYYGVTLCVSPKIAKNYLKLGATLGTCGGGSPARIGVEEQGVEAALSLSVKAYPNPTSGALAVEVNSVVAGPAQLDVLDVAGRPVQQRVQELNAGLNRVEFNLGSQPTGTYLIRCRDSLGQQAVVRVHKQ